MGVSLRELSLAFLQPRGDFPPELGYLTRPLYGPDPGKNQSICTGWRSPHR